MVTYTKGTYPNRQHRKEIKRQLFVVVAGLLLIIVGIASFLLLRHGSLFSGSNSSSASQPNTHRTGNSITKGESPVQAMSHNPATGPSNVGGDKSPYTGGGAITTLQQPSGTFVSNHHPSLSSTDNMASSCNTTPGATCQIVFTKDNVTHSLQAQTTDEGGATYWNWTLQNAGLTAGSWQIKAIATLNGKTMTSTDPMSLEISP